MRSCGSALGVLVLLVSTLTAGSESADPTVKVKLHHPATLPCPKRCSGVVRWTVFHKPTEVLAECDQTSCRSVKEGYQMIYDQYLKGNLSLTITAADFSKRARYTSDCDGEALCDVELLVEPLNTTVLVTPGEALVLKLDVSDPVKVIYRSEGEAGPSSGQICTADGHSARCRDEYEQRASLVSSLQIGGMKTSDSGVYTVVDKLTEEVLHTYTVSVGPADPAVPEWVFPLAMVVMMAVSLVMMLVLMFLLFRRGNSKLQKKELKIHTNELEMDKPGNAPEETKTLLPPAHDQDT